MSIKTLYILLFLGWQHLSAQGKHPCHFKHHVICCMGIQPSWSCWVFSPQLSWSPGHIPHSPATQKSVDAHFCGCVEVMTVSTCGSSWVLEPFVWGFHLCRAVCHNERVCTFWVRGSSLFTCAVLWVIASVCAHFGFGGVHLCHAVCHSKCVHILGSGEFIFHLCHAVRHSKHVCTFWFREFTGALAWSVRGVGVPGQTWYVLPCLGTNPT